MFSKSCQYGLQGVLYIAWRQSLGKSHVSLKEIAQEQDVPYHFLSKILQKLVQHNILQSIKGAHGGFCLKPDADKLNLLEVVSIIDGDLLFNRCVFGLKQCSDKTPCTIHHKYKHIREEIKTTLSNKSVAEHIKDVEDGKAIINFSNSLNN